MQCRILPAALVGVVALISASSVQAASFNDTYAGGANYYNPNANNGDVKGDVIGDVNQFNTTSMDVNRIGADLQVVIHTNYAANPNALGTGFGALFLSTSTINLPGSSPYSTDTFVGNEGRFQYAFTMPFAPNFNGNIATGNGSLYALAGDGSDVQLSHGQGGNNDTSGTNFRNDQAVDYKYKDQAGLSGHDDSTWTVDMLNKTITFLIKNENGMLGTDFALAWAMTCANDIILGNVSVELCPTCGPPPGETPLPAAFSLFAGGLGVLGLAGYRRRKRVSAQV